jgi:hypothetical protein
MHSPSPVQAAHSVHVPLLQVRRCVPQLPQARVDAPSHVWLSQLPQVQSPPQVRVPFAPQLSIVFGTHTP